MPTTQELEAELNKKNADYLRRTKEAGQLPTQISDAWNKAGGAETANLRKQEGDLLTNYVAAAPVAREKYKDIWDPFARDRLAAQSVQQQYAPIAIIRSELAMRADALNQATQSAQAMYSADTQTAQADIGFTQDAYNRALQRDQEQQRRVEREQDYQRSLAAESRAAARSRASTKQSADDKYAAVVNEAGRWMENTYNANKDKMGEDRWTEDVALKALVDKYGNDLDQNAINAILYKARENTWGN